MTVCSRSASEARKDASSMAATLDHAVPLEELCERQSVAVGIGEPCDLVAARRCPDTVFVLVHAVVRLERDAFRRETLNCGFDVRDPPAEHGVTGTGYLRDCRDPQHCAVGVKYAREV